ncbi:hypothetical protein CJU90_2669 [Yarrowia sp. C11]|nr:hypothetical protein CKK34_4116 [Yarrowia sp. E02]KAG5369219.1 hypothetical protein CJU90_2669 [Yarrowia sp. C11]
MPEPTVESLKKEVDFLSAQLRKVTSLVAETGKQVLSIQVNQEKGALNNLTITDVEGKPVQSQREKASSSEDSQAVTSEDLVVLVTELQDQLDNLETKSIRRTANSFAQKDSDLIASLPRIDGMCPAQEASDETHPDWIFPMTLGEFKKLDNAKVEQWMRFYELLPPDEAELAQLQEVLGKEELEEAMENARKSAELTEAEAIERFDTLARFFGIRERRGTKAW